MAVPSVYDILNKNNSLFVKLNILAIGIKYWTSM